MSASGSSTSAGLAPHESLAAAITAAIQGAIAQGQLPTELSGTPAITNIVLDRPKNRDHGDYATSIALALAKPSGKSPREVAEIVQRGLQGNSEIAKIEIAGPGFINITLAKASQGAVVNAILNEQEKFGRVTILSGRKINLEFISANPTGPLHLGHTRWAAVGDALASVLAAGGAEVTREFYINDRGTQMELFGASLRAAARGEARPEEGYQGDYINDLAKLIVAQHPEYLELDEAAGVPAFREAGYALQLQQQKDVLDNFGTHFDIWFSERSLHSGDALSTALNKIGRAHV